VKVKLKGINTVRKRLADGTIRTHYYHRASGRPLEGHPGTPLFLASVAAADKSLREQADGTFSALIERFRASPYFCETLSVASREAYGVKGRRGKLDVVNDEWGSCPASVFSDHDSAEEFARDVLRWRDKLGLKSPRSADNLCSTIARVLSFAKENHEIKYNPLATFKRIYKSDRSELTWSDGLAARFMEVARPAMRTAMMLVRNVGLRASDLRKVAWTHYDGATLSLRTGKRGVWINVPVTIELKSYLDGLPRVGALILTTPTGKAYSKRYFNEHWREDSDLAGAGNLNFHDLRGTAATRLAEAGATAPMIASILGWRAKRAQDIIDTYVARSSTLAAAGIELLEKHRRERTK
jgi:integrase